MPSCLQKPQLRSHLGLEDIRVETEHEADEGLVTFQAVVLAETTGAIALEDLHIDTEDEACKKLVAFRVLVLAEAAGAGTLKLEDLRVWRSCCGGF